MVAGCRVLHSAATGSAQPRRLRASPLRQDQNHRASGSALPGFVPNPRDKGSRAIRVSARWNAPDMTTTVANQQPRINLANGNAKLFSFSNYEKMHFPTNICRKLLDVRYQRNILPPIFGAAMADVGLFTLQASRSPNHSTNSLPRCVTYSPVLSTYTVC